LCGGSTNKHTELCSRTSAFEAQEIKIDSALVGVVRGTLCGGSTNKHTEPCSRTSAFEAQEIKIHNIFIIETS
jgi:hypothetical protein